MSVDGMSGDTHGTGVDDIATDCSKQSPMASTRRRSTLLREFAQPRNIVVGAQMLFVAFSGLVLVPVLMGACSQPEWPLECTINGIASTCRTEPAAKDGFTVTFSHAEQPSFTFTPVGAPTTDRREMVDGSGQRWAMSGHHSFELEEIGGYGNRITVSSP